MEVSSAFHINDFSPGLSDEAQELVDGAERRFRQMLDREPFFPNRIGLVLAAGAATRFRPLTASKGHSDLGMLEDAEKFSAVAWNKASLPLANRALIDFTIADLVASGFRYIVVNVSRLNAPDSIIMAAGDGSRFGADVAVTFSVEDEPAGTYGGVIKMLRRVEEIRRIPPETDVAIFSGDIYTEQPGYEILRAHRERKAAFTLMLNPIADEQKIQFGTVELDENNCIQGFREKDPNSPSNLNNSSRYIARYDLLDRWSSKVTKLPADKSLHARPECFFDFGLHLFTRHLDEIRDAGFLGYVSDKMWADLGRISDFYDVNHYFLKSRVVNKVHFQAQLAQDCELRGNYTIDRGVVIESGSSIRDSILGSGWVVDGARIETSVLMPLPPGYTYRVGRGVTIESCVLGCGSLRESHTGKVIVYNGRKHIVTELR